MIRKSGWVVWGWLLWTVFGAGTAAVAGEPQTLTLPAAIAIAVQHNPHLAAAEGRESAAWSAVDRVSAENWPQLRADGRFVHLSEVPTIAIAAGRTLSLGEEDTWVGAMSVQQLVWAGGRVSALVRQAERNAAAARALKVRALQIVVANAERAFRLQLAAQDQIEAAAKNLAAGEDHLRVARNRLEARVVAKFDVLRAEVGAEEARQEMIRAEADLRIARAALLQALGVREGDFQVVAPPPPATPRPPLAELLAAARRRRAELTVFTRQLEAAEEGIAAARAERYPTLSLAADYQYVNPESNTLYGRWSAGAYLGFPIFDGGRIAARCKEAEAQRTQARAALEIQLQVVDAEVRQAQARAESAGAQVRVAGKRLEQAEDLLRLANVRYEGGVGTATEVADAQASLARARQGLTRAQAEQGIAEVDLDLAVGATLSGAPPGEEERQ